MSYSKAVTGKQLAGPLGTMSAALGRGARPGSGVRVGVD